MHQAPMIFLLSNISLALCAGPIQAQSQTRTVPPFSSIVLDGIGTVRIHKGPQAVILTMDEKLFDLFETNVKQDTLYLGFSCKGFLKNWRLLHTVGKCEIDITVPEIEAITLNGAGSFLADAFDQKALSITVNGAGTIEIQKGSVSTLRLTCNGAAKLDTKDMVAEQCDIKISGSSQISVFVQQLLKVSITGLGTVTYRGNPEISQHISGAGTIRKAADHE